MGPRQAPDHPQAAGPLVGYRVLELGNFIAAPFAGRLFADFGAEVITVEKPASGDELRQWRLGRGDTSMLWRTLARNKKSITLDLRTPEGRDVVLRLVGRTDVLLENFRPGTLDGWGLSRERLQTANPDLVLVQISGYGQTGPYRDRHGFGGVAEAMGGIRHLTGYPDRPPTRTGVSLADSVAGMFGVIGALMALLRRERAARIPADPDPAGDVVDVALYEAVFALMESLVADYDAYGVSRERSGNSLPGVAPSNTYPCADGGWVVIGGNADGVFRRLMAAIGRPELADDPRYADNPSRARHAVELDAVITAWTRDRSVGAVLDVLVRAGVPAGRVYRAEDMLEDPHYRAREMVAAHEVAVEGDAVEKVHFPGVVPKLARNPGSVRWLGPDLGEHNDEVYRDLLGLGDDELAALRDAGVI